MSRVVNACSRLGCLAAGLLLFAAGCAEEADNPNPGPAAKAGPAGPGPGGPGMGGPGGGRARSPMREAMEKIGRGPTALTPTIGKALEAASPDWASIQGQTKEYARLAATLGESKPPRGDEQSWTRLSAAFLASAQALDKAAVAKDKAAALEAHGKLAGSCKECHGQHRMMGRGPGGPQRGGRAAPPPGVLPPDGPAPSGPAGAAAPQPGGPAPKG